MKLQGPPLVPSPFLTIPEALEHAARGSSGVTLVDVHEVETFVSWAELLTSARQVAGALIDRGVAPGDRVALVLPTGRDFLDAFFGAQLAGAVPVPLYPPVRLGRMSEYVRATAAMLSLVEACVVLSDRKVKLLLGQAVELARPRLGAPTVAELREQRRSASRHVTAEALGVIQFSSGSTVDPKPVALTHGQLLAQCAALKALLPEVPGTPQLGVSWLPLYHDMGLIGCLLSAVYYPGPLVLLPPEAFLARPALWLRALSRHRGTVSPAPNFAYGLCLKRLDASDLEGLDLSAWHYALNGAEPVSADTLHRFGERFAAVGFDPAALMPVYGLSEASLALTFTAPRSPTRTLSVDAARLALTGEVQAGARALVSVGTPVPGAEVEVRTDEGTSAGEGRVGRVWARGPFVMRGYFGQPEATARALVDGWLDTGDLGFVADGELYLCGRAKDLVIIRGANHAPQEFEECLDAVEGVRTGCSVALGFVPSDANDEQLLLLVETVGAPSSDLAERVSAAVTAHTGVRPHTVQLLAPGTLPRTSSGKLRRAEALRQHLAGTLSPPGQVNALTMTRELARSALGYARSHLP
jgi:acyl-CoA synthetase (AMP-forming)/AMP-acid ligase II